MTGPEHYREAEKLLALDENLRESGGDPGDMLFAAQVHATLALAAATALIDETPRSDCFANYRAWQDAAGAGESW